jgi:glycosyltransferase involved in cell wall biosynthesis
MSKEFEPGLVSVVLPTFNRASLLREAMSSVWAQTYRPVELLIVDDGSTDNTGQQVRETVQSWPDDSAFHAIYLHQTNRGASAARNQGLLHSHGEFIQYLDSDDVLLRHKLATQVRVLQTDPALDIVWSDWLVVPSRQLQEQWEAGNRVAISPDKTIWQATERTIPWEPWPSLSRRRFVSQHPLWNEKTARWDDWEYALRIMAAKPKRAFAQGIVCLQREHEQGRKQDFGFDFSGLQKGLVDAGEAAAARDCASESSPVLDQHVANRYWEIFIEALHHGSPDQASAAIAGACRYGRRVPFRAKVSLLKIFLQFAGEKATSTLLRRRYLPN